MNKSYLFRVLLAIWLVMTALPCFSQSFPTHLWKNAPVRSIGPATTSGRVTAIDVSEGANTVIYAGTASGGLWQSRSGGVDWQPLFDQQPVMGIGAVKVDPSNPDVIWVGTGEGNPRNSLTAGEGIFRSPDGGVTWKCMGLEKTKSIHRLVVHPSQSNVVYAASPGSAWGPTPDRGVYRTTDGGLSWKKILFVNDSVGCADLVMDTQNPNKLFAAMWKYQRKPWFFESGGHSGGLYMTLDGGDTWQELGKEQGLPEGSTGRIGIAISRTNPLRVYALIESEKTALYASEDGGYHWQQVTDKGVNDRPFYYSEFYVDPSNEHHLIYIHSTVSESIDGGKTWSTLLPYYGVHPDHHAFWWSVQDPDWMIEGNDGGINISHNGGKEWRFVHNLPVGQFYHVSYDWETPYRVYGGLQDNGSWVGPAYAWHEGGLVDGDWKEILFGDGFDVVPVKGNPDEAYAMSQGGELMRLNLNTGASAYVKPATAVGEKLRFNWNAGIAGDPHKAGALYFGSQYLHYSVDGGASWEGLSPDLTTNDTLKQKAAMSGGLTIDATNAENHCTIITIEPSGIDPNMVWVGTDDGQVQLTRDRGRTWQNLSASLPGLPAGSWIAQIVSGAHNSSDAFVVANNYRRNDDTPYLFFTTDYGKTWKNIAAGGGIHGHCLSVVQDPREEALLFLGTEHGLYVSINRGASWSLWNDAYPHVATQDLKIHPVEGDLIIATFGRGLYIMDDLGPLRNVAHQGLAVLDRPLVALPSKPGIIAAECRPVGARFPADGGFEGDNRPNALALHYYKKVESVKNDSAKKDSGKKEEVKKEKGSKQEEKKPDTDDNKKEDEKVRITIKYLGGDTVRWFEHEPDTGLNVVYWDFSTNGVWYPSKEERKKDAELPGNGPVVQAGTYNVVFSCGKLADSVQVNVNYDPRVANAVAIAAKNRELVTKVNVQASRLTERFDQLREMRASITRVKEAWSLEKDSLVKKWIASSDSLEKRISSLEGKVIEMERKDGIRDNSHLLISQVWDCLGYSYGWGMAQGANAQIAFDRLKTSVDAWENEVITLQKGDWVKWRSAMPTRAPQLFKD